MTFSALKKCLLPSIKLLKCTPSSVIFTSFIGSLFELFEINAGVAQPSCPSENT
jgi:hypothetical protein